MVETGRKQHTPVSMVLWHGPTLKKSIATEMDYKKLERATASARRALNNLHEEHLGRILRLLQQDDWPYKKGSRSTYLPRFSVGDFVLVGHRVSQHKLLLRWQGPYVVTKVIHSLELAVRLVGAPENTEMIVHVCHVRRFADKLLGVTQELKRSALHDAESYTVDQILDYEVDTNTPSGFRLQIL